MLNGDIESWLGHMEKVDDSGWNQVVLSGKCMGLYRRCVELSEKWVEMEGLEWKWVEIGEFKCEVGKKCKKPGKTV